MFETSVPERVKVGLASIVGALASFAGLLFGGYWLIVR